VTSNRPPEDWFAVFPDPIVAEQSWTDSFPEPSSSSLHRDARTGKREDAEMNNRQFPLDSTNLQVLNYHYPPGNYHDPDRGIMVTLDSSMSHEISIIFVNLFIYFRIG